MNENKIENAQIEVQNKTKLKNISKNPSQEENEMKVNTSQNKNSPKLTKKAIQTNEKIDSTANYKEKPNNAEISVGHEVLEEKIKEEYDDKNEIEQKKEKEIDNLKEEKKIHKQKENNKNQKSPLTPNISKSAKVKQNTQNSEIESARFSFQTSLSKLAKNETREIGMKEIKEIITKNSTLDFLKIFISVLSSGLKPNYPTEKESRIVIMGWLAEIFQNKIAEASIDKRMVEIIMTYFDDKNPGIKFVSSKTLLQIFEHSSEPIEIIYKTLIEKINSNVSAQSSTIYCLCEIINNGNEEKLLEKMYIDVPELFRKKSDVIPDLINLFGLLLEKGDYSKFGLNKTKIFLDKFLTLLQKYGGMNNFTQTKVDICESLKKLAEKIENSDEPKDNQEQIQLIIKKIEELSRDKDPNVRKSASSCILSLKKNLKRDNEEMNKTPEKNKKFISNLNNVRFLMKLKNNPRSQTKSANQPKRDISNESHLNKKETPPGQGQINPKKNMFENTEKNLKILKEMIQKSMEKLPKISKTSETNFERNSDYQILDKESNENNFMSEKNNNYKGKDHLNLQNRIPNEDLNKINNGRINGLRNLKKDKKKQKSYLEGKIDFENREKLKIEKSPKKDIFSDFDFLCYENLYPKNNINPPQFRSEFYNNIESKLSKQNNSLFTPPIISDWKKILNILSYKNYELAFKETLKIGDDILLLRLIKLTKNKLEFVSPKTREKIILKLKEIQRSNLIDTFFIRMIDDAQKEGILADNERELDY